jgi:subtilisin-like proprotein convertase family protein
MKTVTLLAALASLGMLGLRAEASEVFAFNNLNKTITDGSFAGVIDEQTISSSVSWIGSVRVTLNLSAEYNGDLYVYLVHDGALSVLLNRCGRTAGNLDGYADSGFQVTLSDSSANGDIHTYGSSLSLGLNQPLTSEWQPDGRYVAPNQVLDTDTRTAGLGVFTGADASGTWTLFLADTASGGSSVLNSWQLEFFPVVVPEPSALAMLLLGSGLVLRRLRRG